jgi:hypothetical protein
MAVNRGLHWGIVGPAGIGVLSPDSAATVGTENAAAQISASTISPGSRPDQPLRNQYDRYRGY